MGTFRKRTTLESLLLNEPSRKPSGHSLLAFSRNCAAADIRHRSSGSVETNDWRKRLLQNRRSSLSPCGTQETCCLLDFFWSRRHPPRRFAVIAPTCAGDSRRIQLPATSGHFCAWPPRQSHSPDVEELRDVSCELVSHLFFDVPAGAGFRPCHRTVAWQPVDRRALERCRHVCGDPVDAAGVDAWAMGVVGRGLCRPEFGN